MSNEIRINEIYDTIILGTGPAGFSAAIYAARRNMKTLLIGKEMGGQIIWAHKIENYPGFKTINNFELITKMKEQVEELGVEILNQEVLEIKQNDDKKFTIFVQGKQFLTKTIIIAMGLTPKRLVYTRGKRINRQRSLILRDL